VLEEIKVPKIPASGSGIVAVLTVKGRIFHITKVQKANNKFILEVKGDSVMVAMLFVLRGLQDKDVLIYDFEAIGQIGDFIEV